MRKLSFVAGSLVAVAISGVIGACSDDPVSKVGPRPSALGFSGIEISGPDRVPPGQSVQFTAIIRLADGTRKAASAGTTVQWSTSSGQVLRVNGSGLVTAQQQLGEATLRASTGALQSTKEVTILPDGTFRIVGIVRDAELPTLPVFGARIEATPGQRVATTNFDGRYTLYGVPSEAEIKITRDGYQPNVQSLLLTGNATRDFELVPNGPTNPPTGPYTLAVDVTGTCTALPSDLQHRRYDAIVTRNGTNLEVTLTEPRFRLNASKEGNRFSGRVDALGANFFLSGYSFYYYYYYYPSVVEQLPNGSVLVTEGQVTMRGNAGGMAGQIQSFGSVTNWDSRFPNSARNLGACSLQSAIVLSLTPR